MAPQPEADTPQKNDLPRISRPRPLRLEQAWAQPWAGRTDASPWRPRGALGVTSPPDRVPRAGVPPGSHGRSS